MYKPSLLLSSLLLAPVIGISGCTFFEEPLSDLGEITPGTPPSSDSLPSSDPVTISTLPPPPSQTLPVGQPIPEIEEAPVTEGTGSFFSIASIADIPEDAQNIAVVHFSRTGGNRDTNRDLAMCKALLDQMSATPVSEIPANPTLVTLWPVSIGNTGDTCLEMITNYEPIDISNETAAKVNDSVSGPFLLTRNSALAKRMIFDFSYIPNQSLARGISEWQSLLGSDPANWPGYRSAR